MGSKKSDKKNELLVHDKKRKKKTEKKQMVHSSSTELVEIDEPLDRVDGEYKKKKSSGKNKRDREVEKLADDVQTNPAGEINIDRAKGNSKKSGKAKKKDQFLLKECEKVLDKGGDAEADEVYHVSSGDEDCTKGMKKWITEYRQQRPGLQILQERIDDFITAHEAKLEQERKEKEAQAAEGGWTVVVHHKGRKKTTDSESGIVVGSVAQAAVEDKVAKKKHKEIGSDFYRFQKREAQRNEIMMLQSKFEDDKKRIQQLRAARKFRPY